MVPTAEIELKAFLKSVLTPLLSQRGFRKSGLSYIRDLGEFSWLVDIQKRNALSSEGLDFTINCGVFVEEVFAGYFQRQPPRVPRAEHCCIHARVGMLEPSHCDRWWKIRKTPGFVSPRSSCALEVVQSVEDYVFPFLGRFESLDAVAEQLLQVGGTDESFVWPKSKSVAFAYAGIVLAVKGDTQEALFALESASEAARNSPNEKLIFELLRRYQQPSQEKLPEPN